MGCEVPHRRSIFLNIHIYEIRAWFFYISAYTTLQGGLMLWYSFPPVAAFGFVASVPSSYLASVIACQNEDAIASLRRHLVSKKPVQCAKPISNPLRTLV